MVVNFKYKRPSTKRLGDGLVDWGESQYEVITGVESASKVFDILNKEKVVWNLEIKIGKG
jgi:hypothetical protein